MLGKQYEAQKMSVSNSNGVNQYTKEVNPHFEAQPKERTAQTIAREHGVGRATVERAGNFAKGVATESCWFILTL